MTEPVSVAGRRAAVLALAAGALAAPGVARPAPPEERAVEVADGVFVLRGLHEDASAENANAIANVGFVVGGEAVAVVDPGGTLRHGRLLRAAVARATARPVRHVVVSHVHPDHSMGGAAFADLAGGLDVVAHAAFPEAMAQRLPYYMALLEREAGGVGGSGPLAPRRLLAPGESATLDLGGRALRVRAHPTAHTSNDITAFDEATGTLFAADLVFAERCPSMEGSLRGWIAALDALRAGPGVARCVPGHGPVSLPWPGGSDDLARYLGAVLDETRAAVASGVDIADAPSTVARAESLRWLLAEVYHGRNVTAAYRELEWE